MAGVLAEYLLHQKRWHVVHNFAKGLGVAIVVLGIGAAIPSFSLGGEPPFLLPKDRDSVFRLDMLSGTEYFHFGKDGKYRQINREHMFTAEMDRGTWKQDATGVIELRSSILLKEFALRNSPMGIPVRDIEELEALRPLEKDIEKFLATNKRESFRRDEIDGAWKYTYQWSLFHSTRQSDGVLVDKGVEKVTRKELVELLEAWKRYLKDDAKNRFRLSPVRHGKLVLLASSDYPFFTHRTPEEARRTADLLGGAAAMVYVLVESEPAVREMKTKQPFIFYPELNQGGEEVLRYK